MGHKRSFKHQIYGSNYSKIFSASLPNKEAGPSELNGDKREICRAAACLATQTWWSLVSPSRPSPPLLWLWHCTAIYDDFPTQRGVNITERDTFCWAFFCQSSSQREGGSLVLTRTGSVASWLRALEYFLGSDGDAWWDSCCVKRLLCPVKWEIIRQKCLHVTSSNSLETASPYMIPDPDFIPSSFIWPASNNSHSHTSSLFKP